MGSEALQLGWVDQQNDCRDKRDREGVAPALRRNRKGGGEYLFQRKPATVSESAEELREINTETLPSDSAAWTLLMALVGEALGREGWCWPGSGGDRKGSSANSCFP